MSTARILVALLIGLVGVAIVCLLPYVRWKYAHDRRDFQRAAAPLVRISMATLQADRERTVEFSLPTDRQWRRIVERLDAPVLLVVVATEPGTLHPHVYSAIEAGLTIGASQNGEALALTETKELPYNYWSTQQTAYKFIAAPGPPVQVKVRRTAGSGAASDAFVMVFPHWSSLEMWHWGDSLSMGEGFSALFALLLFVPGVALIFVAVVLALLPLRPTR